MRDRVPTKPNRYAVYDDAHNFLRYEYHERADEPTQVGDALNKANLLSDTVATALGLTGNPQVKDALDKLSRAAMRNTAGGQNTLTDMLGNDFPLPYAKIETGSYIGTGTFGIGNPNSLTFSFPPDAFMIMLKGAYLMGYAYLPFILTSAITTTYQKFTVGYIGESNERDIYIKKSSDGKTITWYSETSNVGQAQLNSSGEWVYLAIGGAS